MVLWFSGYAMMKKTPSKDGQVAWNGRTESRENTRRFLARPMVFPALSSLTIPGVTSPQDSSSICLHMITEILDHILQVLRRA